MHSADTVSTSPLTSFVPSSATGIKSPVAALLTGTG